LSEGELWIFKIINKRHFYFFDVHLTKIYVRYIYDNCQTPYFDLNVIQLLNTLEWCGLAFWTNVQPKNHYKSISIIKKVENEEQSIYSFLIIDLWCHSLILTIVVSLPSFTTSLPLSTTLPSSFTKPSPSPCLHLCRKNMVYNIKHKKS